MNDRQSFIIPLIVVILGILATTAKAEPRNTCGATHFAKTTRAPAPEPKKVEKTTRPAIAIVLPAHKEFLLADVTVPATVKVNSKNDEHFVIMTEAGAETRHEIRAAGLVEAHVVPGSLHIH
jgi:hypothetical protein